MVGNPGQDPPSARTLTNAVYLQVDQAERSGDLAEIARLLPQIEELWPAEPNRYIEIMDSVAGWSSIRYSSVAGPEKSELMRIRSNVLSSALQKQCPEGDGDRHFLRTIRNVITYTTSAMLPLAKDAGIDAQKAATEELIRPMAVPLAEYAGRIRAAMIPLATIRNDSSFYEAYLSKIAWGTNTIPKVEAAAYNMGLEIDHRAYAQVLLSHGTNDPLNVATAKALMQRGVLMSGPMRSRVLSLSRPQDLLREANWDIIEENLIPVWAKIPANGSENIELLEKIAVAARLLPEERQKIGLK